MRFLVLAPGVILLILLVTFYRPSKQELPPASTVQDHGENGQDLANLKSAIVQAREWDRESTRFGMSSAKDLIRSLKAIQITTDVADQIRGQRLTVDFDIEKYRENLRNDESWKFQQFMEREMRDRIKKSGIEIPSIAQSVHDGVPDLVLELIAMRLNPSGQIFYTCRLVLVEKVKTVREPELMRRSTTWASPVRIGLAQDQESLKDEVLSTMKLLVDEFVELHQLGNAPK